MNMTTSQMNSEINGDILVFRVGENSCGVEISKVQEVNRNMDITRVFTAPQFVSGVINLRGRIVTIVDLAARLNVPRIDTSVCPKNIIVHSRGEDIGFRVDEVDDIIHATRSSLLATPPHLPEALGSCTRGILEVENRLVMLLDVDRITE